MPDADGSLDTEEGTQASRPASTTLKPRAALIAACLILTGAAGAAAQQPVVATPPAIPEFFSRFDFHLNAAWLGESSPAVASPAPAATSSVVTSAADHRYSFDTRWGGSLDFVDYVVGRTSFIIDYEAILGDELRLFDPNQGIYTLEAASSARIGDVEVVGIFHHVSRHLADRANKQAVAWNAAGVRVLKRVSHGVTKLDVDAELSRVVAQAFVDYTWIGELNLQVRHPLNEHAAVFAQGSGKLFAVDGTLPNRGLQTGGVAEVGVRLRGTGGVLELFAGFEKRVDAYELERESQRWVLAGFRLLSR